MVAKSELYDYLKANKGVVILNAGQMASDDSLE